jgi:hypothetical protein
VVGVVREIERGKEVVVYSAERIYFFLARPEIGKYELPTSSKIL